MEQNNFNEKNASVNSTSENTYATKVKKTARKQLELLKNNNNIKKYFEFY